MKMYRIFLRIFLAFSWIFEGHFFRVRFPKKVSRLHREQRPRPRLWYDIISHDVSSYHFQTTWRIVQHFLHCSHAILRIDEAYDVILYDISSHHMIEYQFILDMCTLFRFCMFCIYFVYVVYRFCTCFVHVYTRFLYMLYTWVIYVLYTFC